LPVLASRVPDCKETFDEGISGFDVRSVDSLVESIIKFINLPYEQKKAMGIAGRKKMEKEYDRKIVINAYLDEIRNLKGGTI
jgi:glycosyltransferase involved in cell wall biosynthesis